MIRNNNVNMACRVFMSKISGVFIVRNKKQMENENVTLKPEKPLILNNLATV